MIFVQNLTLPDFQVKTFTPSISHNFINLSIKAQKMSKNEEIGKNVTLPSAVTAVTNLTSEVINSNLMQGMESASIFDQPLDSDRDPLLTQGRF